MLGRVVVAMLVVGACRGDAPEAARVPAPEPAQPPDPARPSSPTPDAALAVRPPGAHEVATVGTGGVYLFAIAGDRIYWTENPPDTADDDRAFHVLHWVGRAGGPARQLTGPGRLSSLAVIGDDLYVGGYEFTGRKVKTRHEGETNEVEIRKALVWRVREGVLEPVARAQSGVDTVTAKDLRAHAGRLYWTEAMGRGHLRGPTMVTDPMKGTTRRLLDCSAFDGHHAKCPSLANSDGEPIARRGENELVHLGPTKATPITARCPCGTYLGNIVGTQLLCVELKDTACPAAKGSFLVPFAGGAAVPADALGERIQQVGGHYYHDLDEDTGLRRRRDPAGPDVVVATHAKQFVATATTLAWIEGDRLWVAPLPP